MSTETRTLEIDSDRSVRTSYHLSGMMIDAGEEDFVLEPRSFGNITIERHYNSEFFPIVHCTFFLKIREYVKLIHNRETVKFKLTLKKILTQQDQYDTFLQTYGDNPPSEIIIDNIFQPFFNDINKGYDRDNINVNSDQDDSENDEDDNNRISVELYLFPLNALNQNKVIINTNLTNCTISTALSYIMNKVGSLSNIVAPPDNGEKYPFILLPPNHLNNQLRYLQDMYGVYNSGVSYFFDFNELIIMPEDYSQIPYKEGNYKNVIIKVRKKTSGLSSSDGCYIDSDNKSYNIVMIDQFTYQTNLAIASETTSTRKMYTSFDDVYGSVIFDGSEKFTFNNPYNEVTNENKAYKDSLDKTSYHFNNMSNKTKEQEIKSRSKDADMQINGLFFNIDESIFRKNRLFNFQYEDARDHALYGGLYKLAEMVNTINGQLDNILLDNALSASFVRINSLS